MSTQKAGTFGFLFYHKRKSKLVNKTNGKVQKQILGPSKPLADKTWHKEKIRRRALWVRPYFFSLFFTQAKLNKRGIALRTGFTADSESRTQLR